MFLILCTLLSSFVCAENVNVGLVSIGDKITVTSNEEKSFFVRPVSVEPVDFKADQVLKANANSTIQTTRKDLSFKAPSCSKALLSITFQHHLRYKSPSIEDNLLGLISVSSSYKTDEGIKLTIQKTTNVSPKPQSLEYTSLIIGVALTKDPSCTGAFEIRGNGSIFPISNISFTQFWENGVFLFSPGDKPF